MITSKRFVVSLGVCLALACAHTGAGPGTESDPLGLVGRTFDFNYADFAYAITFVSDEELHWKLTRGEYAGPSSGTDRYYASEIADGIVFVSWVEASGLSLSNVIDFRTRALTTHARDGDTTYINKGTIRELD